MFSNIIFQLNVRLVKGHALYFVNCECPAQNQWELLSVELNLSSGESMTQLHFGDRCLSLGVLKFSTVMLLGWMFVTMPSVPLIQPCSIILFRGILTLLR